MFDHHLVEGLVVAVGDESIRCGFVESAGLFDQPQKRAPAVEQMIHPMLRLGGAKGVDIETDVFAVAAIAVEFQRAHLVERAPQIRVAEGPVLVVFQTVLIVQMKRPELAEAHGEPTADVPVLFRSLEPQRRRRSLRSHHASAANL